MTRADADYRPTLGGSNVSVDVVKGMICENIMKAAEVSFSHDEVIPVSGLWGLCASLLHSAEQEVQATARKTAEIELSTWPGLKRPRGQGETMVQILQKLSSEELAKEMEEASGIHILEQR